MLFHAELAEESTDAYLVQLILTLEGAVDGPRLRRASRTLLGRHPNLRTAFTRLPSGDAVQVVGSGGEARWSEIDLSVLGERAAATRLTELLDEDRATPFDVTVAPLVRIMLVHMPGGAHRLVFTNHHILFDGWSTPLLLEELVTLYLTGGDDDALPRPRPHRGYLQWLARQDRDAAVDAWVRAVADVDDPTLLLPGRAAATEAYTESRDLAYRLDAATSDRLRELTRARGVTLNTVVQASWGIVLGLLTGRDDVVFGATVSGRPPHVAGIETMIGLFINTIPVRVRLDPYARLGELLDRVQAAQSAMLDHHHVGLPEIQRAAGRARSSTRSRCSSRTRPVVRWRRTPTSTGCG